MSAGNRPLSPHLQVYRPQLTSVMSITHRATGVALAVGTLFLACWFFALASGANAFNAVQDFIWSPIGFLLMAGWSFSLFYHLCNGIRHLFWDMGKGFELDQVHRSGMMTIGGAVVLTALAWIISIAAM